METMMVLTKNIVAEATLQERLQTLGYEVYVSNNALQTLLRTACCSDIVAFDFLLISSTVSDEESQQLLKELPPEGPHVFRLDNGQLTEDEQDRWTQLGVTCCIPSESSLTLLRETFASSSVARLRPDQSHPLAQPRPLTESQLRTFLTSLSRKERSVFRVLYRAQGVALQRQEVAEHVWHQAATSSTLAQLSQLVNRIRDKCREHGLSYTLIETHWRTGYQLSTEWQAQLTDAMQHILEEILS